MDDVRLVEIEKLTKKVFERWYTDRPVDEASEHTGLGLAIVRGIAEGYGGRTEILPRDGGGTVFLLEFPSLDVDKDKNS